MMRGLAILLILIFLIFGVPPLISGYYFKQNYMTIVAKSNSIHSVDQHYNIEIIDYREGWFTSDSKVKISSPHHTFHDILVNEHITHGPIIFDFKNMNVQLAYGKVHDEIALASLYPILANQPPIMLTFDSVLDMNNEIHTQINMPQTTVNLPNALQIFSAGLHGLVDVKINPDSSMDINSNITLGNITITSEHGPFKKINLMPITHTGTSKILPSGFMEVNSKTTLPTLAIVTDQNYTLNNINISYIVSTTGDLFNQIFNIDIDSINLPLPNLNEITDLKFHSSVENLSITGFINMQTFFSEPSLETMQNPDSFFPVIANIFTSKSAANNEVAFSTNAGSLQIKAKASWPDQQPMPKTVDDFKSHISVNVDAKASIALVNQFISAYTGMAANEMPQPSANSTNDQPQMQKYIVDSINKNIDDAVSQGYITKDNDNYTTNMTIDSGIIKINGVVYTPAPSAALPMPSPTMQPSSNVAPTMPTQPVTPSPMPQPAPPVPNEPAAVPLPTP